jgi:hypothetical protein
VIILPYERSRKFPNMALEFTTVLHLGIRLSILVYTYLSYMISIYCYSRVQALKEEVLDMRLPSNHNLVFDGITLCNGRMEEPRRRVCCELRPRWQP